MALQNKLNDLTQSAQAKQAEMEAELVNKVKIYIFFKLIGDFYNNSKQQQKNLGKPKTSIKRPNQRIRRDKIQAKHKSSRERKLNKKQRISFASITN